MHCTQQCVTQGQGGSDLSSHVYGTFAFAVMSKVNTSRGLSRGFWQNTSDPEIVTVEAQQVLQMSMSK